MSHISQQVRGLGGEDKGCSKSGSFNSKESTLLIKPNKNNLVGLYRVWLHIELSYSSPQRLLMVLL